VIAIQLYTIRSLLHDPGQLGGVLGRLREIGYRTVEVAGLGPLTVGRFGDELRRAGLTACAAHVPLDRLMSDLDAVAGECGSWGCEYVVVPSLPESYRSAEGYRRFASEAADVGGRLRRHGLRLAYHNHAYELEKFGGRSGLDVLFDPASGDMLEAELDTYWLQFGGVNPASCIRRLANRVPLVHLKDLAVEAGRPVDAEVGEGNLDWIEILGACRDAGTRWLVVEQDDPRGDPLQCVAKSYRNLERLTAQAGIG
jgi:sugar phosphate isomerase/epimerase